MPLPGLLPGTASPRLVLAKAANSPASWSSELRVTIPLFGNSLSIAYGWAPLDPMPKVGDVCLVAIDDVGNPWVVEWLRPSKPSSANTVAIAYRLAARTLAAASFTDIEPDTILSDPGGHFPGGGYVVPEDGFYHVSGNVHAAALANGAVMIASIFVNGVEVIRGNRTNNSTGGNAIVGVEVNGIIFCKAGEGIHLVGFNSGAATALEIASKENRLMVVKVDTAGLRGPEGPAGKVGGQPALVSTLPSSPADGEEVFYQNSAMATQGVVWRLRYREASASAYKWEFVGGPPLGTTTIPAGYETTSAAAVEIPSTPLLTLPLKGDYAFSYTMFAQQQAAGATNLEGFMKRSGGGGVRMYLFVSTATFQGAQITYSQTFTAQEAGWAYGAWVATSGAVKGVFAFVGLQVIPLRVG